jgi:transcriptional regulator with XRE-family HTH domain
VIEATLGTGLNWYQIVFYPSIIAAMTMPRTSSQRQALGSFIRAHRARLTPGLVGLPAGSRRRTPGLRREEVAQLAGLSATWLCWIEQGREVAASSPALDRLADALLLAPAERRYLFDLAGRRDPSEPPAPTDTDVPPALAATLDAIALPAYLLDRLWQVRAWNAPATQLFAGWLDRPGDRNMLHFIFLDPAARLLVCDWETRARRVAAEFRADCGLRLAEPALAALVEELCRRSLFFARCWTEQAVLGREGGERRFNHPRDGLRRYEQLSLSVAARPDLKLVLLTPLAAD